MKIPLSRPDVTEKEIAEVVRVLRSPDLSLGPMVQAFEQKTAEFIGVRHAVAMSSGTAVLHAIVRALGIGDGDFVLTSPFSFISTANCALFERAEPIFVDIDESSYNISPEGCDRVLRHLPSNIKRRVKAVIYVDVFGVPADGPGFEALGREYGMAVVEDSAEAIGAKQGDRYCGSFGDAGLFAFYPNKQITTGEGGILVTNSKELSDLTRSLRNQGRDEGSGWLQHSRLGYNYRISDIACALGMVQLDRIEEMMAKRWRVKAMYDERLNDLIQRGELHLQHNPTNGLVSPFVYTVRLNDRFNKDHRDELLSFLRENGVGCSNYFTPIHLQGHYRSLGWNYGDFPITEYVSERTVALPFYNNLGESDIDFVTMILKKGMGY